MRVLVVEDDQQLAQQVTEALETQGYVIDVAEDGEQAHYMAAVESYDLIVLDLGLPQLDGLSLLQRWREEGQTWPVLILTARGTWHEKVRGMDAGADDYVTKPFHMQELLARVRALLRRASGHASATLSCGDLLLDTRQSQFFYQENALLLTSHEFRLLAYLMHHKEQVVSRGQLTEHMYAQDQERDSNTIDVFVARLRKKIPSVYIQTVRGLGYKLTCPDA